MRKNISRQNHPLFLLRNVVVCVSLLIIVSILFVASSASAQSAVVEDISVIKDGDLIRKENDPDVYIVKIVGNKAFKRLILNPEIFNSYGHLSWDAVLTVIPPLMDAYQTSRLVMEVYSDGTSVTGKVYVLEPDGDVGIKRHLNLSPEQFKGAGYDSDSIYSINHIEAGDTFYTEGEPITIDTSQQQTDTPQPITEVVSPDTNEEEKEECTQEWLEITQRILGTIEVLDGLCIELVSKDSAVGKFILSKKVGGFYLINDNKIAVIEDRGFHTVYSELHEVCHAQQNWYFTSFYNNGSVLKDWVHTKAGTEFLDITGFERVQKRNTTVWIVSTSSPFFGMYGYNDPIELAAELCTLSFLWKYQVHEAKYQYTRDEIADLLRVGKSTGAYAWVHRWVIGQNEETLAEREPGETT